MIELEIAYKEHKYNQEKKRKAEQEKLYDYYVGNGDQIVKYLDSALEVTFDDKDIEEWQKHFINITEKMVNMLAIVYKEPALRYFNSEELTKKYLNVLPIDINSKDKKAHRFAKLLGSSLTEVYFNKRTKRIEYIVRPNHLFTVYWNDDDPNVIDVLMYDKYYTGADGKDELFTVVWTPDEHFKIDGLGNRKVVGNNSKMINPYGVVPFAKLTIKEGDDGWGEGMHDLVNVNEQINVLLTFLANGNIIMGTSGTLLAVNCDLKNKGKVEGENLRKVRRGWKHPIVVENAQTDRVTPSLQHVVATPYIESIQGYIDWYIRTTALAKGLNPNSFLAEVRSTSGYSKIVDSLEQLEIRQDDIEPCRVYEKERFDITRKILEVNGIKIPDEELTIDFQEVKIPETTDEIIKIRSFNLQNNLETPIDWLMENNPDLDYEQAKKQIEANKKINDKYIKEKPKSMLSDLITNGEPNVGREQAE